MHSILQAASKCSDRDSRARVSAPVVRYVRLPPDVRDCFTAAEPPSAAEVRAKLNPP